MMSWLAGSWTVRVPRLAVFFMLLAMLLAGMVVTLTYLVDLSSLRFGAGDTVPFLVRVNGQPISAARWRQAQEAARSSRSHADRDILFEALIDEEFLYQYGVASGMLTTDPGIRSRVIRGVIETVSANIRVPAAAELQQWYAHHISRYTQAEVHQVDGQRAIGDFARLATTVTEDWRQDALQREMRALIAELRAAGTIERAALVVEDPGPPIELPEK